VGNPKIYVDTESSNIFSLSCSTVFLKIPSLLKMLETCKRSKICLKRLTLFSFLLCINLAQCVLENTTHYKFNYFSFFFLKRRTKIFSFISTLIWTQAVRNIFCFGREKSDDKKHTHCSTFICTWWAFLQTFLVEFSKKRKFVAAVAKHKKNYCRNLKLGKK